MAEKTSIKVSPLFVLVERLFLLQQRNFFICDLSIKFVILIL